MVNSKGPLAPRKLAQTHNKNKVGLPANKLGSGFQIDLGEKKDEFPKKRKNNKNRPVKKPKQPPSAKSRRDEKQNDLRVLKARQNKMKVVNSGFTGTFNPLHQHDFIDD